MERGNKQQGLDQREPLIASLALPKGGGALHSIGEKFQANGATGTGAFSVPIAASPGRGGFGPQLALSYDSGAGNGPFGLGWSVGLPSISRKTQRGLPRYDDELDTFLLAGAEDLVPALAPDGARDILTDEGYTTYAGARHTVTRYRPRIEGSFARVERWVRTSDNDTHWRVITGDNITTMFGPTPASRVADGARTYQWLIERSYDDKGNVIVYEYKREDDEGVEATRSHERGRLRDRRAFTQQYLKRIRYGNARPYLVHRADFAPTAWERDNRWFFELVFDYGDHDRAAPDESSPWRTRLDPFSTYRAGFEIRTYRLCRRVLMFHRFDEPELVRSTELHYDGGDGNPIATQLVEVIHTSHEPGRPPAPAPGVRFAYSSAEISSEPRTITSDVIHHVPDGSRTHWLDLDGEGLSGILAQHGGGWLFQRNEGDGRLAAPAVVASVPSVAAAGPGGEQLVDVDGDGRLELVLWTPGLAGAHARTPDGDWSPLRAFEHVPVVEWSDPHLRLIDLTGDGQPDILITEDDRLCWFPSEGAAGYGAARRVARALDEEHGPAIVFADQTQTIFLADMCGDGLTAIVRIRNGEICYWPNTGYGTFGAKVTMDSPPFFAEPGAFDPRRIRLGDVDGTGTSDIFYLGDDALRYWRNQAGNSWSAEQRIAFPRAHDRAAVQITDLLGNGTACVVWTSELPADAGAPLHYLPLMSLGKPYLLTEVDNGMGAVTKVAYAPSTKFYLQDRREGRPWITTLPFPVHVVERVETYDAISNNRFVSLYAYHHGYYDGVERELRGFGMVEQWDTEQYSELGTGGLFPLGTNHVDEASHVPPVHTRTWFHTGCYEEGAAIARRYEAEYYAGDPEAWRLSDTALPPGLTADEQREACRALKGRVLRQEVYALDRDDARAHPYTVAESKHQIRVVQHRDGDRPAVFHVYDAETLTYHYERDPADPRIAHAQVLEVDRYGTVRDAVQIAYPRRRAVLPEQQRLHVTHVETEPIHLDTTPFTYRVGLPYEQRTFEIRGIPHAGPLDERALREAIAAPLVPFTAEDTGRGKRLLAHARTLYYRDTLDPDDPAPPGQAGSLGLAHEQRSLVFTQDILEQVSLGGRITPARLREGGYRNDVDDPSRWWTSSGIQLFDPARAPAMFYLPSGARDAFGAASTVAYDEPRLLFPVRVVDPAGNTTRAEHDYRVLAPCRVTDLNGNRSEAVFDTRGMVIATAIMGKDGELAGDSVAGFRRLDAGDVASEMAAIVADPHRYLQDATTFFYYDLFAWRRDAKPPVAIGLAREIHAADERGTPSPIQISVGYSDGLGRAILTKVQAEDGDAPVYDAAGALALDAGGAPRLARSTDRWVGNGATVFNNKGLPVRQYEPFFDSRPDFTDEAALVRIGVSPVLHYDPLGRVIRTDLPDGTHARVAFGPWQQVTHDPSDTVLDSEWYRARDPADATARKAAVHHDTPARAYLDTLGRPFVTIAHNKRRDGARLVDEYIPARTDLDIEGNALAIYDGRRCEGLALDQAIAHRGNTVMTYVHAMGGLQLHQRGMDAGARWTLADVAGKPIHTWDERGHHTQVVHDRLQRPTHTRVDLPRPDGTTRTITSLRAVYGDELPDADARGRNLRGKPYVVFDGAGCVKTERCDFTGNVLEASRRLFDLRRLPGWPEVEDLRPDWSSLDGAAPATIDRTPLLEAETFTTTSVYDALGRATEVTSPDHSVHVATFNKANLLETVRVRLRGVDERRMVDGIDYNARGQRTAIGYGNGVTTSYAYDARTFRLVQLASHHGTRTLQDLHYTHDAVGNITEARDAAIAPVYFDNDIVEGAGDYVYDSLSRLVEATGRESAASATMPSHGEPTRGRQIPAHDRAIRRYTQQYDYDTAGNILSLRHAAGGSDWHRVYAYRDDSNRLRSTDSPDPSAFTYAHDAHGNLTALAHLERMAWDHTDHLARVQIAPGNAALFAYDGERQRVRKVHLNGTHITERIYLGAFEIYRHYLREDVAPRDELRTLHVMDGETRICLVETPTREERRDLDPSPRFRFQLANHLGSATVELDEDAVVITYEEYHPYGTTAYHAQNGETIRVSAKRYRYTGMERDEETGLSYHAARYYAPWLARWCSTDPIGLADGLNVFEYTASAPTRVVDRTGLGGEDSIWDTIWNHTIGRIMRGARQPSRVQRALRAASVGVKALPAPAVESPHQERTRQDAHRTAEAAAERRGVETRSSRRWPVGSLSLEEVDRELAWQRRTGIRIVRRGGSQGGGSQSGGAQGGGSHGGGGRGGGSQSGGSSLRPTRTSVRAPASRLPRGNGSGVTAGAGILGTIMSALGWVALASSVSMAQTREERAQVLTQAAGDAAVAAIAARFLGSGPAMVLFLQSDQGGLSNEARAAEAEFERAWDAHVAGITGELASTLSLVIPSLIDLLRIQQMRVEHPAGVPMDAGLQATLAQSEQLIQRDLRRLGGDIRASVRQLARQDLAGVRRALVDQGLPRELVMTVLR